MRTSATQQLPGQAQPTLQVKTPSVLDGIKTMSELVERLKPFFLSASLGQPPGAELTATGGRTVQLTNRNKFATAAPTDATIISLVAGTATWNFATSFNNPPIVVFAPFFLDTTPGTQLAIRPPSTSGVVIVSSDAADTRQINLLAYGNPN